MKITIKEPCHENWDKMAPNDKGAFCLSCKKNVIDFSAKTIDEVKTFFTELPVTNNICGRFKERQLNEMSFDHFMNEFMSWKFLQKAAVICFLMFGATLFSGCSNSNDHTVGELVVMQDSLKKSQTAIDTVNDTQMMIGEAAMEEDTICASQIKEKDKIGQPTVHFMGGPMIARDTIEELNHLQGNIKVVSKEKNK